MCTNQYCITDIQHNCTIARSGTSKYEHHDSLCEYKQTENDGYVAIPILSNIAICIHASCALIDLWYYILFGIWILTFKLEWDCWSGPQAEQHILPYSSIKVEFIEYLCNISFLLQIVFRDLILTNYAISVIITIAAIILTTISYSISFKLVESWLGPLCLLGIVAWCCLSQLCCLNWEGIDSILRVNKFPLLEI